MVVVLIMSSSRGVVLEQGHHRPARPAARVADEGDPGAVRTFGDAVHRCCFILRPMVLDNSFWRRLPAASAIIILICLLPALVCAADHLLGGGQARPPISRAS